MMSSIPTHYSILHSLHNTTEIIGYKYEFLQCFVTYLEKTDTTIIYYYYV